MSLLRLLLSNGLRKGAGYLQAFGDVDRTYTTVVNLMVGGDDSMERVGGTRQATQSAECCKSVVASKDGAAETLPKTMMLIGRGH